MYKIHWDLFYLQCLSHGTKSVIFQGTWTFTLKKICIYKTGVMALNVLYFQVLGHDAEEDLYLQNRCHGTKCVIFPGTGT